MFCRKCTATSSCRASLTTSCTSSHIPPCPRACKPRRLPARSSWRSGGKSKSDNNGNNNNWITYQGLPQTQLGGETPEAVRGEAWPAQDGGGCQGHRRTGIPEGDLSKRKVPTIFLVPSIFIIFGNQNQNFIVHPDTKKVILYNLKSYRHSLTSDSWEYFCKENVQVFLQSDVFFFN